MYNNQMIKIVDTREPQEIRERMMELGWTQKALISGDYFFISHDYKKIGIERKTVDDLLNSLNSTEGRLVRQLEQCLDFYDTTILLIEGSWRTVSENDNIISNRGVERTTWKIIWNYLHQFKRKGVIDELTVDSGHTIKRINELYALYQKTFSTSGRVKDAPDDRVNAFPSGCRGKTAINVLEVFGTLTLVGQASVSDLRHIDGIGDKKASLIYEHFHRGMDKVNVKSDKENISPINENPEEQGKLLE